jgi:glycosyltransferase involved in cell wall biosynthesis
VKVLLGCHGFPPRQTAGAEWETYRRARWLIEHGHAASVFAIDEIDLPGGAAPSLVAEVVAGIPVHRLSYGLDQRPGATAEYDNPLTGQALASLLAAERPDVFHVASGYRMTGSTVRAAQAAGVPVVLTLTDFWFACPRIVLRRSTGEVCSVPEDPLDCALCLLNEQRRYRLPFRVTLGASNALLKAWWRGTGYLGFPAAQRLGETMAGRRRFQAETLAATEAVTAASAFLAQVIKRDGAGRDGITVLRQGVNLQPRPRRDDWPGKPLTFGYVGQIAEHKGIDLLVAAFRRLAVGPAEARLLIYGDPARAWPGFWRELRQAIGGDERITMAGPFSRADAPLVYAGLDALVVPSMWYENSPNVILEAFACGVPVLASNLGGMAELVSHDRNGWLFPPGDVGALARALQQVIEHPDRLREWRAAIPPVKTVQQEMEELVQVYQRVIEGSGTQHLRS